MRSGKSPLNREKATKMGPGGKCGRETILKFLFTSPASLSLNGLSWRRN